MARPAPARSLLADETGSFVRRAAREVVLCYPNSYRVAASSLGFQVIWRALNEHQGLACHRAVLSDDGRPARTLELGRGLADHDAILFSIAYELDLGNLASMLEQAGMAPLARDRRDDDPPVVVGGPLTTSNVLPLGPLLPLAPSSWV